MKAVVQRVTEARVSVDGSVRSAIGRGLLVLVGITHHDTPAEATRLAAKVAALRMFEDESGKMNHGALEVGGLILAVSQFTLFGDVRRGNRPSFTGAATAAHAEPLFDAFCRSIEAAGVRCERGVFGAKMSVELVNDGPVTLLLDTDELEKRRTT